MLEELDELDEDDAAEGEALVLVLVLALADDEEDASDFELEELDSDELAPPLLPEEL